MNKKLTRLLALLAFLITVGVVGFMQYMNMSKKGEVTEDAAEAVGAGVNAALDWAKDRSERSIEVVTLIGQTPQVVTVRAQLTMQGASRLSEVCASLPRVRDTINGMLFETVRDKLNGGGRIDLVAYEEPLKAALNHAYKEDAVERVRLSRGNAAMGDTGCTERSAHRGGGEQAEKTEH
jgi:flagellar basal body-associated protein FliL